MSKFCTFGFMEPQDRDISGKYAVYISCEDSENGGLFDEQQRLKVRVFTAKTDTIMEAFAILVSTGVGRTLAYFRREIHARYGAALTDLLDDEEFENISVEDLCTQIEQAALYVIDGIEPPEAKEQHLT